ncbi:FAD-binding protein [Actinoplanes sp. CA-252034]|uniref:FAD-binding protein n=1 Tax=Actinoplanes sp. CA-252034 TaxID=3239906 RepID=UPI003D952E4E
MHSSHVTVVKPGDERYAALTASFNGRWVGTPDYILLPVTADEAVDAVQHVIDNGDRFAIHSSGAGYEDLLTNRRIRAVISTSQLTSVEFDPQRSAFAVGSGVSTVELYQKLYDGWQVTVPAGAGPPVALAGQMTSAGYGPLARQLGQLVDYLEAVEVVVVDGDGRARKVVAGRDADDENHDLWWAHTGGGGGTFGLVTKFWLRSPNARGDDPAAQLPAAPRELIVSEVAWSWDELTEEGFTRLLKNFSTWHAVNSTPASPSVNIFAALKPRHVSAGEFLMSTELDAATPGAQRRLDEFLAAVNEGTGVKYREERSTVGWIEHVTAWRGLGGDGWEGKGRFKAKSAYQRTAFTDEQLRAIHQHLSDPDFDNPATMVEIGGYGGAVNVVDATATATPQRDSIMRLLYLTMWADEAGDDAHLAWLRRWYADVYAVTGGVPDLRGSSDGAVINYIDADLVDETLNTSGTAWHDLYFGSAYPRLQQIKAKWDPRDAFTHALAVRPSHS